MNIILSCFNKLRFYLREIVLFKVIVMNSNFKVDSWFYLYGYRIQMENSFECVKWNSKNVFIFMQLFLLYFFLNDVMQRFT